MSDPVPYYTAPSKKCEECGSTHRRGRVHLFRWLGGETWGWLDEIRHNEDGEPFYVFARHRAKDGLLQVIPVDPHNYVGPMDAGPDAP